jgi:hypothetical protein
MYLADPLDAARARDRPRPQSHARRSTGRRRRRLGRQDCRQRAALVVR